VQVGCTSNYDRKSPVEEREEMVAPIIFRRRPRDLRGSRFSYHRTNDPLALTIFVRSARIPMAVHSERLAVSSKIVGLWRSWERASMAWKRSSVRSRPGPPIFPITCIPNLGTRTTPWEQMGTLTSRGLFESRLPGKQHIDGFPLSHTLFFHPGMRVDLHRGTEFCVAHKFLHHLHVITIFRQQ
jgi:hypothetical protein